MPPTRVTIKTYQRRLDQPKLQLFKKRWRRTKSATINTCQVSNTFRPHTARRWPKLKWPPALKVRLSVSADHRLLASSLFFVRLFVCEFRKQKWRKYIQGNDLLWAKQYFLFVCLFERAIVRVLKDWIWVSSSSLMTHSSVLLLINGQAARA